MTKYKDKVEMSYGAVETETERGEAGETNYIIAKDKKNLDVSHILGMMIHESDDHSAECETKQGISQNNTETDNPLWESLSSYLVHKLYHCPYCM